tara:strand:- start:123 stop:1301 length:1179 start_codon:yes stop_codon:yes gene_type:complete
MNLIYNIIITIYHFLIIFNAMFNSKSNEWLRGRKILWTDLGLKTKNKKNIVWFHCASHGEYEQAKELIKAYKLKYKNHKILLTFFSASGYQNFKDLNLVDFVFYIPLDTKQNAKKFIEIVNPIKVIFVKYEFWFNFISEISKNNIPLYYVSVIIRYDMFLLKLAWFRNKLKKITHIFLQDQNSADILLKHGFNNFSVSGDTRFDTVLNNSKKTKENNLIEKFCGESFVIIGGSTWDVEEKILIKYIKKFPEKKYIIAPHELNRLDKLQKYTNGIMFSTASLKNIHKSNVLIIDSIGLLPTLYRYANIAFIGGGFAKGIHNVLEAIVFKVPAIIGPNHHKSNEANELIELEYIEVINNYYEFITALKKLNFTKISEEYIKKNSGAVKKIVNAI